jgi:hypothetical protein
MSSIDHPPGPRRCPACGDVVGVYEPSVAVGADGPRVHGSSAAVGDDFPVAAFYHRECLETSET